MGEVVQVLTACAAVVAAVLSAVTLYVTGRRAERAWRRDALVDALEGYAATSFARLSLSNKVMARRRSGAAPAEWTDLTERDRDLHGEHNDRLTRLRLLANPRVVQAAEDLHVADDEVLSVALATTAAPDAAEETAIVDLKQADQIAKKHFFDEARRELGLGPAAEFGTLLNTRGRSRW
jgi:hypothetical protein